MAALPASPGRGGERSCGCVPDLDHAPARHAVARALALVAVAIPAGVRRRRRAQPVTIQLLNVSDWHGNIDPVATARWRLEHLGALEAGSPRLPVPISLTAGDDFGASPPLSGFFDEVPAVMAERLMGIQVAPSATTTSTRASITCSR